MKIGDIVKPSMNNYQNAETRYKVVDNKCGVYELENLTYKDEDVVIEWSRADYYYEVINRKNLTKKK